MREEVRQYLNSLKVFDTCDLVMRAFSRFDTHEVEYFPQYESIFRDDANVDAGITLTRIIEATEEYLIELIQRYGITPSEETRLTALLSILEGLDRLEAYEDKVAIRDILDLEIGMEEKAVNLLTLVTSLNEFELDGAIETAELAWLKDETVVYNEIQPADEAYLVAVKQFMSFLNMAHPELDETFMPQRFREGLRVSYDLGFYLQMLAPLLESLPPQEAAANFIYAVIAAEGLNPIALPQTWAANSELLVSDVLKIAEITKELNALLLEYGQYAQN